MIDFQDFKREYINANLPKLYAGEMDADISQIVWNMTSDECAEFNNAAFNLWALGTSKPMEELLEKLAIEYLADEAKEEYKNMLAIIEDGRGEEEAFWQMNR